MDNRSYKNELLKQTDPYAFFLQAGSRTRSTEAGDFRKQDGPCGLLPQIPGLVEESYTIPNISETYVILRTDAVGLYPEAVRSLLCPCLQADDPEDLPDLIYCDHDYQDQNGKRHTPFLKPEYSPHTLLACNYMGELIAIREETLKKILESSKRLRTGIRELSAPDAIYAILLSLIGVTNKISHVTETLFYLKEARREEELYRAFIEDAQKHEPAVFREEALGRLRIEMNRPRSLSVIIPSKDHAEILIRCLQSIADSRFHEKNSLEVILTDNGSCREQKEKIKTFLDGQLPFPVSYQYHEEEFNYARMCHRGAQAAKGELLLFLNDDTELLASGDLERMCAFASAPLSGAVGAKLLFPGGKKIQHVGVTSLPCGPTHKLSHHDDGETCYFGANRLDRNVLAVTGACLMVAREKYFQVNGFHDKMGISYNDVDLCVCLYEAGYWNILLNSCILLHHESLSRGSDLYDEGKLKRLFSEKQVLYERHPALLTGTDPFYHPDLITDTLDFRVNVAADYEMRDRASEVATFACKKHRFSDKLKLEVENTGIETDVLTGSKLYYSLSGWSLYPGHDECMYERALLLAEEGTESCLKVQMLPVYRKDVQEVFRDQKHALLAGFYVRIPVSLLKEDKKYRVMLLYEHRIFHYRIITPGAEYEPGKGYDKG
ncbi:MAG: glycosyltransferase [Lachnospiraceae bacterium]|nr:glycosyltransferase [Lachnospiraceae bacterium]